MLCVVQKPFSGPEGAVFAPNTLIDAADFRNRDTLIANRYLRIATADEIASAEEVDEEDALPPPPKVKVRVRARARKARK